MKNSIVMFASYNEGDEYDRKVVQVEKLREEGININLFYLLKLENDLWEGGKRLPKTNVDRLIITNIRYAINTFEPNILAFHNGTTIQIRQKEFKIAIEHIQTYNSEITYLIEHLNCPERSYYFSQNKDFFEWCKKKFENEHVLYDEVWKPNI